MISLTRAQCLGGRALARPPRCSVHGGPDVLKPLHGFLANTAGGRMPQYGRLRANAIGLADQIAHGHALQHHRCRGLVVDAIRDLHCAIRRQQPLARITTDGTRVGNPIARLQMCDIFPDRLDYTGTFTAGDKGHGRLRIKPATMIDVDEVDPDCGLSKPNLICGRLPDRNLLERQGLRPAVAVNANCMRHGSISSWELD